MNRKADLNRAKIKASIFAKSVNRKSAETADALASTASKAAAAAADAASGAADTAGKAISQAASNAAKQANDSAAKAAAAAQDGIKFIHEHTPSEQLRKARLDGFEHGLKQGAYIASKQRFDFYCAYIATLCFFLQCDGEYGDDERAWLETVIESESHKGLFDSRTTDSLRMIAANEAITAEEVEAYLDKVSIASLARIDASLQLAMEVDGEIAEEELEARERFTVYLRKRAQGDPDDKMRAERIIEESVREYDGNLARINREFEEKTKLQSFDAAFLFGATMLQAARVLVVNALTTIERAGKGNAREKRLHRVQDKCLGNKVLKDKVFKDKDYVEKAHSSRLRAPENQILHDHRVPYDATTFAGGNPGIFKGANHRFATLGHDPVLGLLFGTSNIMTNTITCVGEKGAAPLLNIPITSFVKYDTMGKHPLISPAPNFPLTIEMLIAAGQRVVDEPEIAAAAFLKQVIHIGTDLYTPCGIQLPLANMILDKSHVGALTRYVSTGDLIKVGAQAGLAVIFNLLIASLHGSLLLFSDDCSPYATELYQARTKKIILISNTIATSSSIIQTANTRNPRCLDLGGAAILLHQLFKSADFIARLKREYVNSELDKIYDERAKGVL